MQTKSSTKCVLYSVWNKCYFTKCCVWISSRLGYCRLICRCNNKTEKQNEFPLKTPRMIL